MTSSASKLTCILAPGCPSDKTFTRLLEGLLSAEELQELQAHGDGCAACGRTLAELARTMTPGHGDWLGERYQLLYGSMRELARREPTFALHVHVGVADSADARSNSTGCPIGPERHREEES